MKTTPAVVFTLFAYFAFLTYSPFILASEYYVSPLGSDNHFGSLNSPFKTINKGISVLQAGDILFVREGTYVETIYLSKSGTKDAPISIMAYPGESPIIDGEDKLPDINWGALVNLPGDYIYFSGFEVRNCNITGKYKGGEGVVLAGKHNKGSNLNVHHIWETGILASGDYTIIEDCKAWQCAFSNSINPGSMGSGWATGISAARSPVDGITTNAILRRNVAYNNWGEGVSSFEAEGTLVEDNITYDNWSVNLYISDTRNALIQRNIVYNTPNNIVGQRRPFTLGDERADKPRSANNMVINNLIYNADLWAFWSTGVPGSGLDNVLIAHNTIINGQLEIGASSSDKAYNKSGLIFNNIFYNENNLPWEIQGPLTNLTFSHNYWSQLPPSSLTSIHDKLGNPLLLRSGHTGAGKLTSEYFKLQDSSPAINSGTTLTEVNEDFFKTLRDSKPDIGAYEHPSPPFSEKKKKL